MSRRSRLAARGWAPLAALAVYLMLVCAAQWVATATGAPLCLCSFKMLTGLPCPTCGATRAALALVSGGLADAWHWNPLVTCAYLIAPLWLALRFLARRRVVRQTPKPVRWAALGILALAAAVNWAYLIASKV